MALAAAELVCDLTTICNQAGEWFMQQDPAYTGYPETTSLAYYYANAFPAQTNAPSKEIACSKLGIVYGTTVTYNSGTNKCVGTGVNSDVTTVGGSCASGYTASGTTCNLNSVSHLATDSDWSAKQSLLNDDRFTPHLLDAGEDVPGDGFYCRLVKLNNITTINPGS